MAVTMSLPRVSSEVSLERVVEELESTFTNLQDFLGLRALGNVYEQIAERHRSSDVSRWVVIEWFERAAAMYKAALTAYRDQSIVQIQGFGEYLEKRVSDVETLAGHLKPYGQRPTAAREPEAIIAGVR